MLAWLHKRRSATTETPDKASRRRKLVRITLGAVLTVGLLSLWLPYRVAMLRLFFWAGGSRMLISLEYKPLNSPHYVPVADATQYPPETEVLGLEIGGIARSIPVNRLAWHLVVNDEIAGQPVLVTLCTVTDAAIAYRATCRSQTLQFAPARLARNNLVLRDAQTGSVWQQFTGKAFEGPLAGAQLEQLPLERCRLDEWQKRHPASVILDPCGDHRDRTAPNDTCPVMSYFSTEPFLLQTPSHEDERLPRKEKVVGKLPSDERATACPLVNHIDRPEQTGRQVRCYWFAWVEFHAETELTESLGTTQPVPSTSDTSADRRMR
jgi:hypothetical protein